MAKVKLVDYLTAAGQLRSRGIKSVRSAYVGSAEAAASFSRGRPIALKVLSQKALHKSRSGLVRLGLSTPQAIASAYGALSRKARSLGPHRIIAQEMVASRAELIIGGKVDPQFGRLLLLGLGGIYVEAFRDFSIGICPVGKRDALSMLAALRSRKIIAPTPALEAELVALLASASRFFSSAQVSEMDLNPVMLTGEGYLAVDIRMLK